MPEFLAELVRQQRQLARRMERADSRSRRTLEYRVGERSAEREAPFTVRLAGSTSVTVAAGPAIRAGGQQWHVVPMSIDGGGTSVSPSDLRTVTGINAAGFIVLLLNNTLNPTSLSPSFVAGAAVPKDDDGQYLTRAIARVEFADGAVTAVEQLADGAWLSTWLVGDGISVNTSPTGRHQWFGYDDPDDYTIDTHQSLFTYADAYLFGLRPSNGTHLRYASVGWLRESVEELIQSEIDYISLYWDDLEDTQGGLWQAPDGLIPMVENNTLKLVDPDLELYFPPGPHPHRGDIHDEESFENDDHNPSKSAGEGNKTFGYIANTGNYERNKMDAGLGDASGDPSVNVNGRSLIAQNGEPRIAWSDDEVEIYGDCRVRNLDGTEFRDLTVRRIKTEAGEHGSIQVGDNVYMPMLIDAIDATDGRGYTYEILARKV